MPTARAGIDDRGRPCVFAQGKVHGVYRRRRKLASSMERAEIMAEELRRRFALDDFSWLGGGRRAAEPSPTPAVVQPSPTLADYAEDWIEGLRGLVGEHTRASYRSAIRRVVEQVGQVPLDALRPGDLVALTAKWTRDEAAAATIRDRMNVLRQLYRDARLAGVVESWPFDTPLPRRQTKGDRAQARARRVDFRPFAAAELDALLAVLRAPKGLEEETFSPVTEALLLTGLRWGEAAALRWEAANWRGRRLEVRAAKERYGGQVGPTKTGRIWSIPLRPPLEALLRRQRERTLVGGSGWIFGGEGLTYERWHDAWSRFLVRAKVSPRGGEAQKALRRSYVTSALVCGRNPKQVSAELGHATARMVVQVYDSFLDPASWPNEEERAALVAIYGWGGPAGSPRSDDLPDAAPTGRAKP